VTETANRFGHFDILVNNAGILLRGPADAFSLPDFDRMLAVNVHAFFAAVQTAVAHMGEGGRIITIGSVTADRSGFPGASVYSMTKAAVAALTRGLARDLGSRGITVNTCSPDRPKPLGLKILWSPSQTVPAAWENRATGDVESAKLSGKVVPGFHAGKHASLMDCFSLVMQFPDGHAAISNR
jgi:NAD(P)-dependent dehydrogenase (short-subunit alcohol dehydrogenase family)